MKISFLKIIKHPFVINIGIAIVLTLVLIWGALKGLDIYTQHGQAVVVPDVKGLSLQEAETFFQNNGLSYSVIDSVHSKSVKPGSIVEVSPEAGSKVKEGRIIYVTINAFSAQTASIPDVTDMSFRQAQALLAAQGFTSIEIAYVQGQYKDLAIGVEANGRRLNEGDKVPLTTPLLLKVSSGDSSFVDDSTSVIPTVIENDEEKWF